jgi:hypothetical protein
MHSNTPPPRRSRPYCWNVATQLWHPGEEAMMRTKTVLLLGAGTVALITGCASDVKHQRHSNAAIKQIKEQRRACYADTALSIDDGVSDAGTIGKAVSAHCRRYTDELIRLASSDGSHTVRSIQQHADEGATTYVVEFRRLKKLPG